MTSFQVADVFTVSGRGLVVTGRAQDGTVRVGDRLWLLTSDGHQAVTVVGFVSFCWRGTGERIVQPGENAGLIVTGVTAAQVNVGDVLSDAPAG